MTVRTSRKTVTFGRPFVLQGFAHVLPPGDYVIDMEEERLDTSLTLAWRRLSTVMRVRVAGVVESRAVNPDENKRRERSGCEITPKFEGEIERLFRKYCVGEPPRENETRPFCRPKDKPGEVWAVDRARLVRFFQAACEAA